ncbi:MAG: hypothetical protein WEK74_11710, partial [Hydrogenophaga sp.]
LFKFDRPMLAGRHEFTFVFGERVTKNNNDRKPWVSASTSGKKRKGPSEQNKSMLFNFLGYRSSVDGKRINRLMSPRP